MFSKNCEKKNVEKNCEKNSEKKMWKKKWFFLLKKQNGGNKMAENKFCFSYMQMSYYK